MNIIFDLDGTLIDCQYPAGAMAAMAAGAPAPKRVCDESLSGMHIYKRPGLHELLDFCFENFQNVGLWSHSGPEWVAAVLSDVIETTARYDWSFIYTADRATGIRKGDCLMSTDGTYPKDLKKVYRRKDLRAGGFERHNTIIVEDTPNNCLRNYGNAIYVSSYDVVRNPHDRELFLLRRYLENKILGCENVRSIEKRSWKAEAAEWEERRKLQTRKVQSATSFWMQDNWQKYVSLGIKPTTTVRCGGGYAVQ